MNPHASRSVSPFALYHSLKTNRSLVFGLIQREVVGRYRGSTLGLAWSLFNPVLMLAVYTFVFSVVFKARWVGGTESKVEFALVLYSGLMVYNLFSECVNRAPSLILGNVNYVKKVVFPLELLPVIAFGSAFFHFIVSLIVWLGFYLICFGVPHATIFQLPLVILPFFFMTLGMSWFLASLGVFLRDVTQVVGILTTVLMFLSPIFYPISALPEEYQHFMQLSPLTLVVEQTRNVVVWGNNLDWSDLMIHSGVSLVVSWLGFAWFQKTRKGFADVL